MWRVHIKCNLLQPKNWKRKQGGNQLRAGLKLSGSSTEFLAENCTEHFTHILVKMVEFREIQNVALRRIMVILLITQL